MKNFISRLSLVLFVILGLVPMVRADDPSYTGTTFDGVQAVLDDATLFFGAVVVLAIVVTGFFLGRKWLRRVG